MLDRVFVSVYVYVMNVTSFRKLLKDMAEEAGSQRNLAKKLGVSPMFICDILQGRREPGGKILKAMGLQREVRIIRTVTIKARP